MSEFDNVGFDGLKEMYKEALADKEKAEQRIAEIRQAFEKELSEIEEIRVSLGITDSVTEKETVGDTQKKENKYTNIFTNAEDFITIDFRRIFGWFMSYILPIIVVALVVFMAVKVLHRPTSTTFNDGITVEQEVQVVENDLGELWYE